MLIGQRYFEIVIILYFEVKTERRSINVLFHFPTLRINRSSLGKKLHLIRNIFLPPLKLFEIVGVAELADRVVLNRGNISIEYCPMDEMVGDYMTKPLQGSKFTKFRRLIMGDQQTQPMVKVNGSHHQYGIIRTTRDQNVKQHAGQDSNGQTCQD